MTKLLLLLSQGNYFCSLQRWAFTQKNDEAKVPFTLMMKLKSHLLIQSWGSCVGL